MPLFVVMIDRKPCHATLSLTCFLLAANTTDPMLFRFHSSEIFYAYPKIRLNTLYFCSFVQALPANSPITGFETGILAKVFNRLVFPTPSTNTMRHVLHSSARFPQTSIAPLENTSYGLV